MASSLNGLSVGDSLAAENLMESPARSESACYPRYSSYSFTIFSFDI